MSPSFDSTTVAKLDKSKAKPVIKVIDDPNNVVVFSLYYYPVGSPLPSNPAVSQQDAEDYPGWTPSDLVADLFGKQVALSVTLKPMVASGNEQAIAAVYQDGSRVDDKAGLINVPIPAGNPPPAFITKWIGVTFAPL